MRSIINKQKKHEEFIQEILNQIVIFLEQFSNLLQPEHRHAFQHQPYNSIAIYHIICSYMQDASIFPVINKLVCEVGSQASEGQNTFMLCGMHVFGEYCRCRVD